MPNQTDNFASPMSADSFQFGGAEPVVGFEAPDPIPGMMPKAQDLMSLSDKKRETVAQTSEEKRERLGGMDRSPLTAATAVEEGNNLGEEEFLQEIANGTTNEIIARYGQEAGDFARNFYLARERLGQVEAMSRAGGDQLKDALLSVGKGAVQGVGGMAGLAAGTVNDQAGAYIAEQTQRAGEALQDEQSFFLNESRRLGAVRSGLDREDNAAQFEKDVAEGRSYPRVRRFLNEAGDAISDFAQNPELAADVGFEGVGSLVGSGGVGGIAAKAATKVILKSKGMSGEVARQYLMTPQGRELQRRVTDGSMTAAIGGLEGGGAYSQIQQEIQAMSEAELMEGSSEYVALREQGMDHEQSRDRIANLAGVKGGAIQGLIGATIGKVSGAAGFEASLVTGRAGGAPGSLVGSWAQAGRNVLKETVEEAPQEASSGIVSGAMIQEYADPDRDITEGAGTDAVAGIVGGAGTGAVVQAPRLAGDTARAAGRGVVGGVQSRVAASEQRRDDESPVGSNAVTEASTNLQGSLDTLSQQMAEEQSTTVPESSENVETGETVTEEKPAALTMQQIGDLANVRGAELTALPANIQRTFNENNDEIPADASLARWEILNGTLSDLKSGKLSAEDQADAALWVNDQAQRLEALKSVDISGMPEGAQEAIKQSRQMADTILGSPVVQKALEAAQQAESASLGSMPEITSENLSSPEVQKAARQQTSLAQSNPAGVDPKFVDALLAQNIPDMDPRKRASLKAASDLSKEAEQAAAAKEKLKDRATAEMKAKGLTGKAQSLIDTVRQQILEAGKRNELKQWGLTRHVSEVSSAVAQGDLIKAQNRLDNLGNFAQHMQNKLSATRESYKLNRGDKNQISYRTWTGERWIEADEEGAWKAYANPNSPNSMLFAREVGVDAASVARTYNSLLEAYGDQLTGKPMSFKEADGSFDMTNEQNVEDDTVIETETEADEVAATTEAETSEVTDGAEGEPAEAGTREAQDDTAQASEPAGSETDGGTSDPTGEGEQEEVGTQETSDQEGETDGESGTEERTEADVVAENVETPEAPSFDNLATNPDGISRFVRAFRIKPENSGAMQAESPMQVLRTLLGSIEEYSGNLGLSYPVHEDRAKALLGLVENELVPMMAQMNERLKNNGEDSAFGKGPAKNRIYLSPLEALAGESVLKADGSPVDFTASRSGFSLNIVDPATGKYDPRLLEAAAVASLHWVQTTLTETNIKMEDVAEYWGVPESDLQPWMVWASNNGLRQGIAKESLAKEIRKFWGVEDNKQAPESDTQGILEGVAAELLEVMEGRLTTFRLISKEESGSQKTPGIVEPRNDKTRETIRDLMVMDSFLADVFLMDPEQPYFFDEVPSGKVTNQKGNLLKTTSKLDQEAIDNHRAIPHTVNRPLTRLNQVLGRETWLAMRGHSDFDPATTHTMTQESLRGKNMALEMSYDRSMAHVERNDFVAGEEKNPDEVVTYFDYFLGKNDRIMAKGFNGQANKTMREMMSPTRNTLDLDLEEHQQAFWLSVAQSLGLKVEKLAPGTDLEAESRKIIEEKHSAVAGEFFSWIDGGMGKLPDESNQVMLEEVKRNGPLEDKTEHALLSVARFDHAREQAKEGGYSEAWSEFDHRLAFEADGVSDGAINAIVHMGVGISEELLRGISRGGYLVNSEAQSLNEYKQHDGTDIYESAAAETNSRTQGFRRNFKGGSQERAHVDRLLRVLTFMGEDVSITDGKLVIGRKALKNPMTITLYGSTADGIAKKVAGGLLEVLYSDLSDLAKMRVDQKKPALELKDLPKYKDKGYEGVWDDIQALMTKQLYKPKSGKWFVSNRLNAMDKKSEVSFPGWNEVRDIMKFQPDAKNTEMLVRNIRTMYVDHMIAAIDEATAGANERSRLLQATTQIQGLTLLEAFKTEVARKEKEKGEALSKAEREQTYEELSKFGAIIESVSGNRDDTTHLNFSTMVSQAADGKIDRKIKTDRKERTRSLTGGYGGNSMVFLPKVPGPAAAPGMVIGTGDARMMKLAMTGTDVPLKSQPVFDGWELAVLDALKGSERVNEAVLKGWEENPLQVAYESYRDWLRQKPLDQIQDANTLDAMWDAIASMEPKGMPEGAKGEFEAFVQQEMMRSFPDAPSETWTIPDAYDDAKSRYEWLSEYNKKLLPGLKKVTKQKLDMLEISLRNAAEDVQARTNVFNKLGVSVDHMAGAQAPFVREGEIIETNGNDKILARTLKRRHKKELEKIQSKREDKASRPTVQEPDARFQELITKHGYPVKTRLGQKVEGSVQRLSVKGVRNLMQDAKLSKDHWAIYQAMEKKLPKFKILIGSPEDLNAYRDKFHPEMADVDGTEIQLGMTDHRNGIIYLANQSPETMLHELLHGVTSAATFDFYETPSKLSDEQKAALTNLENMMNQFQGMDFSNEDANAGAVAETLQSTIREYLGNGGNIGKAVALQEFIAWSLTNQNLTDSLKTAKVRTPLMKLVNKALQGLRRMLGLPGGQNLDLFVNIQWNTGALIAMSKSNRLTAAQRRATVPAGLVMQQVSPNNDTRLQRLMERFEARVASHLRELEVSDQKLEGLDIKQVSDRSLNLVVSSGFDLDAQQQSAYKSMQAALASTMELDHGAMMKAQELFTATIEKLSVEDLMVNPEMDANGNQDPNDRAEAQEKFNLLVGKYGTDKDRQGRSSTLATFLALSQIDPQLRKALKKQEMPKGEKINPRNQTVNELLENTADNLIGRLSNRIIKGDVSGARVGPVIDKLAGILSEAEKTDASVFESMAQDFIGENNERVSAVLSKGGELITSLATPAQARTHASDIRKNLDLGLEGIGALLTRDTAKQKAATKTIASIRNNASGKSVLIPEFALKIIDEVVGVTEENRPIYNLMNPVRYAVSRIRQIYRKDMPKVLAKQFSRKLTDAEWSNMHLGLARTDLASLFPLLQVRDIRGLITETGKLDLAINKEKETLRGLAKKDLISSYLKGAEDLAKWMVTGDIDPDNHMLVKNAEAIAHLAGTEMVQQEVDKEVVASIDRLTSLQALNMLDPAVTESLAQLARDETEGFDYMVNYLIDLHAHELGKATTGVARANGHKGYVPSDAKAGVSLKVAEDYEHNNLVSMGYTRQGDYTGSDLEGGRKGYYYTTVGGNPIFSQGVMQTVQKTARGVDVTTGRDLTGTTGGMITGPDVALIHDKIMKSQFQASGEPLMPVFDENWNVIGYERSMKPEQIKKMRKNTHVGEMIGAWAGRHVEEAMAEEFNSKLIQATHKIWKKGITENRRGEFIDLSDKSQTNEIQRDAWNGIPKETKREIERVFGEDGFMVSKSMIDNTVGFRNMSVSEFWKGPSDMSPGMRKNLRMAIEAMPGLGKNAFKTLVTAEKAIEAGVGVAKNIIVVLSIVVPVSNAASNVAQAMMNGVPVRDIINGAKKKVVEVERFQKLEKRRVEITADKARFRNNDVQLRKLDAEEKSIDDAISRMSIAPMLEAGEFTSLVEGETEFDSAITQGTWAEKISEFADRIPEKFGTVGKYAAITRDTALFKGLSRSVQYGDFIAKSIVYDNMVKKQGKSKQEALNYVTEQFVNYNLLPSRQRKYAESIGASWFWAFKLRSIKVAHGLIRDNPLRVLLMGMGSPIVPDLPGVNVGSPIEDNALTAIAEGRAKWTLGWGMLFRAPGLHPVAGALTPF